MILLVLMMELENCQKGCRVYKTFLQLLLSEQNWQKNLKIIVNYHQTLL